MAFIFFHVCQYGQAAAKAQPNQQGVSAVTLDDLYLTLHQAARGHNGGIRALAQRLGKREKTLYSKLDPRDETHEPALGEFVAMVLCFSPETQAEILDRFAGIFGLGVGTRVQAYSDSLVRAVLRSVSEHADVVRAVELALEDGVIDVAERTLILREISEARRALAVLENSLDHQAGGDA